MGFKHYIIDGGGVWNASMTILKGKFHLFIFRASIIICQRTFQLSVFYIETGIGVYIIIHIIWEMIQTYNL